MYVYDPIALDEIRICELGPGDFDNDITITLRIERFDPGRPPVYEALSYAWGSILFTSSVRNMGVSNEDCNIPITRNLEIALRHIRHPHETRMLWVDSLCIDQSNNEEKGFQVNKMGDIYHLAERVIVWLGPEEHISSRALDLCEDMGSQVDFHASSFNITSSGTARNVDLGDMTIRLPYGEEDLTCIYRLLCRPWFERLWVRQEILQANSCAIAMCGFRVVSWPKFRRALACVYLKSRTPFPHAKQLETRLDMVRTLLLGQQGVSLSTLRRDFGMLQCTNPRDRVYAVLAIIRRRCPGLDVRPDYQKPVFKVYEDFVTRYMRQSRDISFLTACQLKDDTSDIPSWVPDWSNRVKTRVETRIWSANAMFASGHLAAPLSDAGEGKLELKGSSIGKIQETRSIPLGVPETEQDFARIARYIAPNQSLDSEYVGGGTLLEAYVQAMCLEAFAENFSPPLEHLPKLKPSMEAMRQILSSNIDANPPSKDSVLFLSRMYMTLGGRCLFQADSGHIGIGPAQIKAGDILCVALGLSLPVLLRQVNGRMNEYRLVGTCYARGISQGEAFLGPFHKDVRMVQTLQEGGSLSSKQWRRAFSNSKNGDSSITDPRLLSWPVDLEEYRKRLEEGEENFLKVKPEVLNKRGIQLESFILV
jgi:hypothetical protein